MRIFVILILSVFVHNQLHAGNITPEVRQAYKERTEFVKKYISTIKENRKTNKKFNEINNFDLSSHHDPKKLIRLCVTSGNNLSEISKFIQPFVNDFENYNEDDLNKHLLESGDVIDFFLSELAEIDDWSEESFELIINKALEDLNLPMPKIGLPIRVALLGRKNSPHLSSTIYLIAKEIALSRLEKAKKVISEH